jgi:hypothetical protein
MWHAPGGGVTPPMVTAIVAFPVRAVPVALVPLPLMVSVNVPATAVLPAVTVTTLLVVAGLVPNATVTPAGAPDAVNVTGPVNPPPSVTLMVSVALPFAGTPRVAAEGVKVNDGFWLTIPPTLTAITTG